MVRGIRSARLSSSRRTLVAATVTPLASIFGSGFLIIVPVMERGFGGAAWLAVIVVCLVAMAIGAAVRANIRRVEGAGPEVVGSTVARLSVAATAAIALAYAISVGLYLQIMAGYGFAYAGLDSPDGERVVSTSVIVFLVVVGVVRGFGGLFQLEAAAMAVTVVLMTGLLASFALKVASLSTEPGPLAIPPVPDHSLWTQAALLGGVIISVQGFETSRYLGDEYTSEVRVTTSRLSQLLSSAFYIAFVALCMPLMATATPGAAPDGTLLGIVERAAPLLALPLAVTGVFSQFSAAIADLVTGAGNIEEFSRRRVSTAVAYIVLGAVGVTVVWAFSTLSLVAVASRAFAVFYALQCLTAMLTARTMRARAGFALLAAAMVFVVLFAEPVG